MNATFDHSPASIARAEEAMAFRQVSKLRGFYLHAFQYVLIVSGLALVNLLSFPQYLWFLWVALGWGIGLASHAISLFGILPFLGADWEKREVERRLGRPL